MTRAHRGSRRTVIGRKRRPAAGSCAPVGAPARARSPKAGYLRAVPCPDCAAAIGQACRTAAGVEQSHPHASRRRMAIRKFFADQALMY